MELVTYSHNNADPRTGVRVGDEIVDVAGILGDDTLRSMRSLLAAGPAVLASLGEAVTSAPPGIQVSEVVLLTPIADPPRIFAIGRNYAEHAKEGKADVPDFPMIFFKPATTLIGAGEDIVVPPSTSKVDWEGELAVVIGTAGKRIAQEDALGYVAGYAVSNDVTARDWQRRTTQFDSGKMFDTFCPLGPAIVTSDEVDPQNLWITTTVNGTVMQKGSTADMIFPVAQLVSYLSEAVQLLPGDIILSGTPAGVGYARETPVFLHPGDVVSVEISGLGTLTSTVVAETV